MEKRTWRTYPSSGARRRAPAPAARQHPPAVGFGWPAAGVGPRAPAPAARQHRPSAGARRRVPGPTARQKLNLGGLLLELGRVRPLQFLGSIFLLLELDTLFVPALRFLEGPGLAVLEAPPDEEFGREGFCDREAFVLLNREESRTETSPPTTPSELRR